MLGLDAEFGRLEDPQRPTDDPPVDTWEQGNRPSSWTELTKGSSTQLRSLMNDVRAGFVAGQVLVNDVVIIWLVTENGGIRFAVEEMVHNDRPTGLPKLQSFPLTRFSKKLGHPSLVIDDPQQRGRIGGEIRLRVANGNPYWQINRKSGRYSYQEDRSYIHLKNVADRFRRHGIELSIDPDF